MRAISLDAGIEAGYLAPADTVLVALGSALELRGLKLEEEARLDSATTMVIASRGGSFFSYGEFVRALVRERPAPAPSAVKIVARSRYALDLSGRVDRIAPRLLQSLDGALGGDAVTPQPGDRVRGRLGTNAGRYVTGTATAGPEGPLFSSDATAADTPIPMAALTDLEVFRGSYSHRSEGATIGLLLGMVAGTLIGYATEPSREYRGAAAVSGAILGGGTGLLLGVVVGELIRTEVWSATGPYR